MRTTLRCEIGSSGSQEGRDAKKPGVRSKRGNGRDTLSAHSSIRAVAGASTPAGYARMRMRQMKWRGTRGFIIAASQSFKGVDEKDGCTLAQDVPVCQWSLRTLRGRKDQEGCVHKEA